MATGTRAAAAAVAVGESGTFRGPGFPPSAKLLAGCAEGDGGVEGSRAVRVKGKRVFFLLFFLIVVDPVLFFHVIAPLHKWGSKDTLMISE